MNVKTVFSQFKMGKLELPTRLSVTAVAARFVVQLAHRFVTRMP
jgi:hypothetical protein